MLWELFHLKILSRWQLIQVLKSSVETPRAPGLILLLVFRFILPALISRIHPVKGDLPVFRGGFNLRLHVKSRLVEVARSS